MTACEHGVECDDTGTATTTIRGWKVCERCAQEMRVQDAADRDYERYFSPHPNRYGE